MPFRNRCGEAANKRVIYSAEPLCLYAIAHAGLIVRGFMLNNARLGDDLQCHVLFLGTSNGKASFETLAESTLQAFLRLSVVMVWSFHNQVAVCLSSKLHNVAVFV